MWEVLVRFAWLPSWGYGWQSNATKMPSQTCFISLVVSSKAVFQLWYISHCTLQPCSMKSHCRSCELCSIAWTLDSSSFSISAEIQDISVQRNAIHADDTTSSQTADGLQRTARFLQHWLWAFWDAGDTGGDKSPSSLHLFKILGRLTALSMASLWKKLTTYTCRASSDSHKTRETGSRQPIPPCHLSCCVFINHVLTIRIKIAIFQPV